MEIEWLLFYSVLGSIVGIFAGLFGVGGGAIMVPVLTTVFVMQGFPHQHVVHMSLATSMAAIVLTSLSSTLAHHKRNGVLWTVVVKMTPGIITGTFGAALIVALITSRTLAIFFSVFMAYVSIQLLSNIKPKPARELPHGFVLSIVGLAIGGVSALVAIGGGTMTVPFLTWCNIKIQNAIGTSAAIGLPISIVGTVGYLVSGWGVEGMPMVTYGYVYLPAVVMISIVSVITAPIGAKLAHNLPVDILKRLFALLLMLLCVKMLFSVFSV